MLTRELDLATQEDLTAHFKSFREYVDKIELTSTSGLEEAQTFRKMASDKQKRIIGKREVQVLTE